MVRYDEVFCRTSAMERRNVWNAMTDDEKYESGEGSTYCGRRHRTSYGLKPMAAPAQETGLFDKPTNVLPSSAEAEGCCQSRTIPETEDCALSVIFMIVLMLLLVLWVFVYAN
uniref:Uncharacterized protein n=1 Tax=Anatid alphaherpesvirus 2 TaxID=3080522 RepID=A0AAU0K742_9ALPH